MEANLAALRADIETTLKATSTLSMPAGVGHRDAEGQFVSSDSAVASMVSSLGGTLLMQGYADRWFDRKHGWLVLPDLPTVNQEKILLAGQSEVLSMSWVRWERLHQTARYGDTDVHALAGSDLPNGCPESIALVYARDASRDTLDFIANQRTIDREAIATVDLSGSTSISRIGKGIAGTVAEAPAEFVSTEEAINVLALSEAVGYEILKDQERPGGLRLVQWIRGYMCLSELASSRSASGAADLPRVSRADLIDLLQRASLTKAEAKVFLDAVSFGRGRRDLFDAPVVRTKGDWMLIGPALVAPRMAKDRSVAAGLDGHPAQTQGICLRGARAHPVEEQRDRCAVREGKQGRRDVRVRRPRLVERPHLPLRVQEPQALGQRLDPGLPIPPGGPFRHQAGPQAPRRTDNMAGDRHGRVWGDRGRKDARPLPPAERHVLHPGRRRGRLRLRLVGAKSFLRGRLAAGGARSQASRQRRGAQPSGREAHMAWRRADPRGPDRGDGRRRASSPS